MIDLGYHTVGIYKYNDECLIVSSMCQKIYKNYQNQIFKLLIFKKNILQYSYKDTHYS